MIDEIQIGDWVEFTGDESYSIHPTEDRKLRTGERVQVSDLLLLAEGRIQYQCKQYGTTFLQLLRRKDVRKVDGPGQDTNICTSNQLLWGGCICKGC